ncbi:hypothetical protein DC31_05755 [Microbacterium sp. CH12i]|uniref:DUF3846 domain-containing protein n=1 Tax=Microbacterium sp. CH12i TaxID=1479651 RepID=UPI00046115D9|nr:DUF3846 domain-containing protein [Microbacterium sp. CH12i]KDA04635.1 hypothetical protein DC31_05755 [Microbacterium sp. CH12i]
MSNTNGLLITTGGQVTDATFTGLEDYQRAVGGYIETVDIDGNHDLIANEEGLIQQLPLNRLASLIARRPIVGNAVVVGFKSSEFVDIDDELAGTIRSLAG